MRCEITEFLLKNKGTKFSANEIAYHLNENVDVTRRKLKGLRKCKIVKHEYRRHFSVKKYYIYCM